MNQWADNVDGSKIQLPMQKYLKGIKWYKYINIKFPSCSRIKAQSVKSPF
jgi:hypothetical protein